MSAILSLDELNDFITPGVACIKPVETLPLKQEDVATDVYEVTTEDKVAATTATPASISLTDCLACSGCVTSAEAVLISLQSHAEVLDTLDAHPELPIPCDPSQDGKIFVASVSPQSRASIAATYGCSERQAGNMINQLLSGSDGLRSGGRHGGGFAWVVDTNPMRQVALVAAADEVIDAVAHSSSTSRQTPKRPVLTSACPGWICYAEKTHPHILPHISRVKSPQALTGIMLKTVLAKNLGVSPDRIWHLSVMPCFDKKLEASRQELTDAYWRDDQERGTTKAIRDVDCVITARELLMLAETRGISFPLLSRKSIPKAQRTPFPDSVLERFLFSSSRGQNGNVPSLAGTSGGYLWHVMQTYKARHDGASLQVQPGRNTDVVDYVLKDNTTEQPLVRTARYYGFRNIQNLVRKLKVKAPSRMPALARAQSGIKSLALESAGSPGNAMKDYAYIEVMACPGGCSNGGGQIKVSDVGMLQTQGGHGEHEIQTKVPTEKEWLGMVDEAYYSADPDHDSEDEHDEIPDTNETYENDDTIDGVSRKDITNIMQHWSSSTGINLDTLLYTSYRRVESDVGKSKVGDAERVAGLASSIGGGW